MLKLPIRHPVLVAKQVSTVAVMTQERLSLGVGLSPWIEDYRVCGEEWESRGARSEEMIEIIRGLMKGDYFGFRGDFDKQVDYLRKAVAASGQPPEKSTELAKLLLAAAMTICPRHRDQTKLRANFLPIVGDALGLSHPLTAEGILPAIVSGKTCAEAILSGEGHTYGQRLRQHRLFTDYRLLHALRRLGGWRGTRARERAPAFGKLGSKLVASGFGWLFGGEPLPGGAIGRALLSRRSFGSEDESGVLEKPLAERSLAGR